MQDNNRVFDIGEELFTREELFGDGVSGYDAETVMLMVCHNASRAEVMSGRAPYDVYKDIIGVGIPAAALGRYRQQMELLSLIESWILPAETWDALILDALNGAAVRSRVARAGARAGSAECILVEWAASFKVLLPGRGRDAPVLPERDRERVKALLRGEDLEVRKAIGGLLPAWTGTLEELIHGGREVVKLGRSIPASGGAHGSVIENPGQTSSEFGAGHEKTLGPGF